VREFAFLFAAIIGVAIGISLQPFGRDILNVFDDLEFCRQDLAVASLSEPLIARRTTERDKAIEEAERWQGFYDDARKQIITLTANLSEARQLNTQLRYVYEEARQRSEQLPPFAETGGNAKLKAPPPKPKTTKKKKKSKPTTVKKRKPVHRHRWFW
jgi:hypothetical protein